MKMSQRPTTYWRISMWLDVAFSLFFSLFSSSVLFSHSKSLSRKNSEYGWDFSVEREWESERKREQNVIAYKFSCVCFKRMHRKTHFNRNKVNERICIVWWKEHSAIFSFFLLSFFFSSSFRQRNQQNRFLFTIFKYAVIHPKTKNVFLVESHWQTSYRLMQQTLWLSIHFGAVNSSAKWMRSGEGGELLRYFLASELIEHTHMYRTECQRCTIWTQQNVSI